MGEILRHGGETGGGSSDSQPAKEGRQGKAAELPPQRRKTFMTTSAAPFVPIAPHAGHASGHLDYHGRFSMGSGGIRGPGESAGRSLLEFDCSQNSRSPGPP